MIEILKKDRLALLLQSIFVFFLPLLQQVSVVSFVLLFILYAFTGGVKNSIRYLRVNRFVWIFIGFYLLHVIGLLYSDNLKYGLFDLQVKLSFLIFPLVIPVVFKSNLDWKRIRFSFLLGVTVASLWCLIRASMDYFNTGQPEVFFYLAYSRLLHTTYFTLYINFAIILLLYKIYTEPCASRSMLWLNRFLLFFLSFNILLLSSRTATAVAYLSIIFWLFVFLRAKILQSRIYIPIVFFFSLVIAGHSILLRINNRFTQVENELKVSMSSHDVANLGNTDTIIQQSDNSTNIRYHLWNTAIEVISDNPVLGVGIGDIKEVLVAYYKKNNYSYGVKERISPHNQYLHTGVILGMIGIIALFLMFFYPLLIAFRNKDWIYTSFLIIVILNCLTESVIEVQKGILFYSFFNMVLFIRMNNKSILGNEY